MRGARNLLALGILLLAAPVLAHSPATSQLTLQDDAGQLRVTADVAVIDLAQLLPIDANGDQRITWSELLAAQPAIDRRVLASAEIGNAESNCNLRLQPGVTALVRYGEVQHLSLRYASDCPASGAFTVAFGLFNELDPGHRVYLRTADAGALQVLGSGRPTATLTLTGSQDAASMLREGVVHILGGYDHLLFLLLLVLPAFSAAGLRARALHLAGIITTFTLAHSVTLGLAATGLVALPGKPVEIAIALSIVAAGLLNVWRPEHRIGWKLAAGFGLLHGFGFAGALAEIGLSGGSLAVNLLAFNLGVEIGQLLVVAAALPVLVVLALWSRYSAMLVPALSAAGATLGLVWTVARL